MKKRFLVMALALSMACLATGCKSDDYKNAQSLYEEGKYEEAGTMFEALGEYKDSADMYVASRYFMACDLQDAEKYDDAIAIYDELGEYEQAIANKEKCNLGKASKLIEENNYEEALAIVENYQDSEEGKHLADICKVHINGMKGLIEYMKENIEKNSDGDNAKAVYTGKNADVKDLIYYEDSSNSLKVQATAKDNGKSDNMSFTMFLSGTDKGEYKFIYDNLTKISPSSIYNYDSVMVVGNNYYAGYVVNALGKVDLAKFKKDQKVKIDTFKVNKSDDDLSDAELKKITQAILPAQVDLVFEGLQKFLNDENLRTSLADLGIKKYVPIFSDDPYASPVTTSDYSADRTISAQEAENNN